MSGSDENDLLARLAEQGLVLPAPATPVGDYVPARQHGALVFTAGQLPLVAGVLTARGVVVEDSEDQVTDGWIVDTETLDVPSAAACAATAALNCLAAAATVIDLADLVGVVKVTGYVAAAPGFRSHAAVLNGASELFGSLFGPRGAHARSAVGVATLPLGAPVEVEATFEVRQ